MQVCKDQIGNRPDQHGNVYLYRLSFQELFICSRGVCFFICHEITRYRQKQRDGRIQQVPEFHSEKIQNGAFHGGIVDAVKTYDHDNGYAPEKVEINYALHLVIFFFSPLSIRSRRVPRMQDTKKSLENFI